MAHHTDPRAPRSRRLYLVPQGGSRAATPLPTVVPLLRPDQPVTPAQESLLTAIARRTRLGDREARDLLWRAFSPRLEPALLRCGRMVWMEGWARRDGRPWALDDLRQEAWLVFVDLAGKWDGEGSFVPYITAYFPWRLRNALRGHGPTRQSAPAWAAASKPVDCPDLHDAAYAALVEDIAAALSPADAAVLRLWAGGSSLGEIARQLGVCRRTVTRRWARIRRLARVMLDDTPGAPARHGDVR